MFNIKQLNKEVAKATTETKASLLSKIETVASEKNKKTEDAVTIKAKKLKSKKQFKIKILIFS